MIYFILKKNVFVLISYANKKLEKLEILRIDKVSGKIFPQDKGKIIFYKLGKIFLNFNNLCFLIEFKFYI